MYGNFEEFPQYWCIVWVGDIITPAWESICTCNCHVLWSFVSPSYGDILPLEILASNIAKAAGNIETLLMEEIRQSPVDMENLPSFTGFYTCRAVQNFFHQQQESIKHL